MSNPEPDRNQGFESRTGYLILLALGFLILFLPVSVGIVLWLGRTVAQVQMFVLIIFFSLIAAIVTFYIFKDSAAEVSGQQNGRAFRIVGPFAAFLVCVSLLSWVAPKPETKMVRTILVHKGQQLAGAFKINPTVDGVDVGEQESQNDRVLMQLPAHVDQFDAVIVKRPGFRLKTKGPIKFESNIASIHVVHEGSIPPAKPGERPSPSIFKDLPTREEVSKPAANAPDKCGFQYRNMTDETLRLLILDCSRYYRIQDEKRVGEEAWLDFPFDPSDEFKYYQHLDNTTGWHCFAVMDENRNVYALKPTSAKNLCEKTLSKMTVTSPQEGDFEVTWE